MSIFNQIQEDFSSWSALMCWTVRWQGDKMQTHLLADHLSSRLQEEKQNNIKHDRKTSCDMSSSQSELSPVWFFNWNMLTFIDICSRQIIIVLDDRLLTLRHHAELTDYKRHLPDPVFVCPPPRLDLLAKYWLQCLCERHFENACSYR